MKWLLFFFSPFDIKNKETLLFWLCFEKLFLLLLGTWLFLCVPLEAKGIEEDFRIFLTVYSLFITQETLERL